MKGESTDQEDLFWSDMAAVERCKWQFDIPSKHVEKVSGYGETGNNKENQNKNIEDAVIFTYQSAGQYKMWRESSQENRKLQEWH